MAYATTSDVQSRMMRTMADTELAVCEALLEDASVMIDAMAPNAWEDAKKIVSCRMVVRALGDGASNGYPIGTVQGSMSGLGYSQSWSTGSSGGANGELYLSKIEKQMLGVGNNIGAHSPVEDLANGKGRNLW